jgi:hypothetical protein
VLIVVVWHLSVVGMRSAVFWGSVSVFYCFLSSILPLLISLFAVPEGRKPVLVSIHILICMFIIVFTIYPNYYM